MADDTEKVVFLAFDNPNKLHTESVAVHACSKCRNKTFTLQHDRPETFPMLRCACCGQDIGRVGWAE